MNCRKTCNLSPILLLGVKNKMATIKIRDEAQKLYINMNCRWAFVLNWREGTCFLEDEPQKSQQSKSQPKSWNFCPLIFSTIHMFFQKMSHKKSKVKSPSRNLGILFCRLIFFHNSHVFPEDKPQKLGPIQLKIRAKTFQRMIINQIRI